MFFYFFLKLKQYKYLQGTYINTIHMGEAIFFTIMIIATVSVLIIGYYAKRMNERERR